MTDSQKLDLLLSEMKEVKTDVHLLKEDVQSLKEDVQTLKDDVQTLKDDVHLLKEDTQTLKEEVHLLKEDVSVLKRKVSSLEEKVDNLSQRTDTIEDKMIQTNLILENEIRVNIQRVAEGHLDLSRNLHEAMKPNAEVEMLTLRVGKLESDMREVKARFA